MVSFDRSIGSRITKFNKNFVAWLFSYSNCQKFNVNYKYRPIHDRYIAKKMTQKNIIQYGVKGHQQTIHLRYVGMLILKLSEI